MARGGIERRVFGTKGTAIVVLLLESCTCSAAREEGGETLYARYHSIRQCVVSRERV
jgi:hypothetical protein